MLLGACAYSYTDQHGNSRIVGLVNMRIPNTQEQEKIGGTNIDISTIGIFTYSTPINKGFSIGYSRERLSSIKDDSLIIPNLLMEEPQD